MNRSRCSASSFCSLVSLTCLLVLSAAPAFAQLSSASLNGVVRDTTGAVIPKAGVVLTNADTSVERANTTNDTGNYVFTDIAPGRYTLKVSAPSFSTKQVSPFVLAVNQTATIDVSLAAGASTEVVTVEASAQLQVSTAELGTVIATKQVNDLPLNGRNFTQLLSLTPGVAPISVSQNNMSGGGFTAPVAENSEFQFPAINGATNRSNYFLTDGLTNFGAFLSTYAVPPIVDAIQEFKVVSHTDSAEFGGVLGGVVNVVTKSGTDHFHGSAWEYIRNDAFDARDKFLAPGAKKPSFRQNQFGASIGGPVEIPKLYNGKSKTFFFFAYQGFRFSKPASSNILVPTATQLGGDFSALCTSGFDSTGVCNDRDPSSATPNAPIHQLYNPFTTTQPSSGVFTRQPFAGNIIPSNLIDSRLVGYAQAIFPAAGPLFNGGTANAVDNTPTIQHQNEYNVRIDQTFGQKDSVWFRYSRIDSTLSNSGGLPELISEDVIPARNWGASYVHVFSPSLELQVQYARTTVQDNAAVKFTKLDSASVDTAAGFSPDFASNFAGTKGWLIPGPNISGFANGGEKVQNDPKATDNHQISGTLTKLKGTHDLKFGGGFTSSSFASPISYDTLGFNAAQTNSPGIAGTGYSLASFLINVPDNANRRNVNEQTRLGGELNAFVQDSWKATPRLTINYGLRYDLTLIPPYGTEATVGQQGGIETGDINFNDGTYVIQHPPPPCSVRGAAPCIPDIAGQPAGTLPAHVVIDQRGKIAHNTYTNFGPHAGFAYRIGENTVVRGSSGVIYDNWAAVSQMAQNIEGDWPGIGQLIQNGMNLPNSATADKNTGQPLASSQNPFGANGAAGLPPATPFGSGAVQWYYDPNIKNAYSIQYNFGVQRQLNSSTTVSGNYVGAINKRLNVGGYYNTALTPGPGDPQARALYPYMEATFYDRSIGNGNYNAFQFQLDKRFTSGLAYQVAYTYSKSIDEGSSGWFGVEGQSLADPYDIKGSRSVSGFDLTHVLSVNTVYQIPIGQGKRFSTGNHVVDYVVGNWQVNGIFLARSGQPYTMIYSQDQANTGNVGWAGYERANLVGDPNSGTCSNGAKAGTAACYVNNTAFAVPAQYTYGTTGRDQFRTAPFWNLDMSIFRQFPLWSESRRIEFRAEAFNLFNTLIFGQPGNDLNNLSNFGQVTKAANSPRQLQFGAKIIF
jgi:hypothetical protein